MKKKIIITISIVLFILALVAINIFLNSQNNIEAKQKPVKQEEKIIEITGQNFEEEVLKSEIPVLVDFYATWCGPCKVLSPILEEIAQENEMVKFVRVDVDKEDDIAMQYKIMSIPTLVLIQNGEEKDRIIGLVDKAKILEFIEGKE